MTEVGRLFQTDGAEHRKARFPNSVLVNGLTSYGTSDDHQMTTVTEYAAWCGDTEVGGYNAVVDLVGQHSYLVILCWTGIIIASIITFG